MALSLLHDYVELMFPHTCVVVDLLKIAREATTSVLRPTREPSFSFQPDGGFLPSSSPSRTFRLVIDGECCLNRLYGGFLADWVCGGQWTRALDFLGTLVNFMVSNNIDVTVFFDGAADRNRTGQWMQMQLAEKDKMDGVLHHLTTKGTPPPNVLWVAPNCLRSTLRMIFLQVNVRVVVSARDHRHEVMEYVRKHRCHGLMADDPEYIVYGPPRYFSARKMKLTFKGCLVIKEYLLEEIARCFNIHPSRMFIVAAVLANHMLSETDLKTFHRNLCPSERGEIPPCKLLKAVVDFARDVRNIDDLDAVAGLVFGRGSLDKRRTLKMCLSYYARGSHSNTIVCRELASKNLGSRSQSTENETLEKNTNGKTELFKTPSDSLWTMKFQSQTELYPETPSNSSKLLQRCAVTNEESATSMTLQASKIADVSKCDSQTNRFGVDASNSESIPYQDHKYQSDGYNGSARNIASNDHSPNVDHFVSTDLVDCSRTVTDMNVKILENSDQRIVLENSLSPSDHALVLSIVERRHRAGEIEPSIYQVLTHRELKVSAAFECLNASDLPSPSLLFRPLRLRVYAVLFNQYHHSKSAAKKERRNIEKPPDIVVREWVWSKDNESFKPELVPALPLGWAVPAVTRLWFGNEAGCSEHRMRAFLTCMRSDTPLMYNVKFVPPRRLMLCCVLRYMASSTVPILNRKELDAFLVTALDPRLGGVPADDSLHLPLVSRRAVLLAALFMSGVENALFANDACGAPLSRPICCPWLFFDGMIFHLTWQKAMRSKSLAELCDNQIKLIRAVERMRCAVLQGLEDCLIRSTDSSHVGTFPPSSESCPQLPTEETSVNGAVGR